MIFSKKRLFSLEKSRSFYLLPNNDPLVLGQIHLICVLYVEGFVPLGEVSRGHIRAQNRGAVNVNGEKHLLELGSRLLAPHSCPVAEILLVGRTLGSRHNVKSYRHTAVVRHILADDKRAVDLTPRKLDAVKLRYHLLNLQVEALEVILGPPVIDVAVLVALRAVAVKRVGDLVTDNAADTAKVLASGALLFLEADQK